jgi:hypothetical protein
VGRSTIPAHRVLRYPPKGRSKKLILRIEADRVLLQADGVRIDQNGCLVDDKLIWDFSEEVQARYDAQKATASSIADVCSGSDVDVDMGACAGDATDASDGGSYQASGEGDGAFTAFEEEKEAPVFSSQEHGSGTSGAESF